METETDVGLVAQVLPAHRAARGRSWPAASPAVQRARMELGRGRTGAARTLLRRQLEADPDDLEALFLMSGLHYEKARFGVALEGLEQVLRRGPAFAGWETVFYIYGRCQMRLGQAEEARAAFAAALEFAPGNGEVLFALGELDLQEGRAEAALQRLDQALRTFQAARGRGEQVDGPLAAVHARMGDAYLKQDELEPARSHLEQALALAPDDGATHYALSRVLLRLGDSEGAARELETYQRLGVEEGFNRPVSGDDEER